MQESVPRGCCVSLVLWYEEPSSRKVVTVAHFSHLELLHDSREEHVIELDALRHVGTVLQVQAHRHIGGGQGVQGAQDGALFREERGKGAEGSALGGGRGAEDGALLREERELC